MKNVIPFFSEHEPDAIKQNSLELISILEAAELDAEKLQQTVESRESLINDYLKAVEKADKSLLEDLFKTNQELTKLVESLKDNQQGVLVGFLRNRKAVKKYKK